MKHSFLTPLAALTLTAFTSCASHTFVDRTGGTAIVIGPGSYVQTPDGTLTQLDHKNPDLPPIVDADTLGYLKTW